MSIKNVKELDARIKELESKRSLLEGALVSKFEKVTEQLKPLNLIKSTFQGITHSPDLRSDMIKGALGLGVGILTKKLLIGKSTGIIASLLSTGLKLGLAKTAVNQSDKIRAYGKAIFNNLLHKKS
jgi:F0F1-type ATP synthase assembly protein I